MLAERTAAPPGPPAWLMAAPWLLCGLISTTQAHFLYPPRDDVSFLYSLVWQYPPWLYLAAAAPLVAAMARRFPLARATWARHLPLHLLCNAAVAAGYAAVVVATNIQLSPDSYFQETPFLVAFGKMLAKGVQLQLIVYWLIVAIVHAWAFHRKARAAELATCQLETALVHAQLESLKMQLHPHFLFNTLHAIGVLVRKSDIQGSLKMLSGLADLLRLALENTGRQLVPLKQELDFLGRYLAIEQIRFQDRLVVHIDASPELLDALVPNLILQPLLENAIRHGIAPRAAAGRVEVRATADHGALTLAIVDDGLGLPDKFCASSCPGVGLRNVQQRLANLYPGDHIFDVAAAQGGGVAVHLRIPLAFQETDHGQP